MQERYIASVDLGSAKIALTVAKVSGFDVQVLFFKEAASDGIRYSSVFNPKRAAEALRPLIREAEEELHIRIMQVVIGLPRYDIRQESNTASLDRDPNLCITQEEVESLKDSAIDSYPLADNTGEELYGAVAQSFSTEDLFQQTEQDIVGVASPVLSGNFKVFVGAKKAVSNIEKVMNELGLAYYTYFMPEAVAHTVLTSEEMENGCALVECGAGVTSLTIYNGNILRYYASIPFGGKNITTDIKYECGIQERLAENIKLAFGACMPDKLQSMSEKIIQIMDDESGACEQIPVKYLSEIIDSRMREIVTAILFLIQKSGYADNLRNGIILTGGGANLTNSANLVREMSGYNVRIGYPRTRVLSSSGCPGLSETDAVASVALLLLAKDNTYLNCIEEAPAGAAYNNSDVTVEQQPEEDEPVKETLFDDTEIKVEEPVRKKQTTRKTDPKPHKPIIPVKWTGKIMEGIESLFSEGYDKAN